MLPLRLVFGLLLLLTSLQLWAEPITFTELSVQPNNGISLAGQIIPGKASDEAFYSAPIPGHITHLPACVENTQGTLSLEVADTTDFLRCGVVPVRPLSANSSTETLFSRTKTQPNHPVSSFNGIASPLAWDNLNVNPVPEPAALILLGSGLAVLAALTKQRKRKRETGGWDSSGKSGEVQKSPAPPEPHDFPRPS